MSEPVRRLLPVVTPGHSPTRTTGDRLEVLHALMKAPGFEELFAQDVIRIPEQHEAYGWICRVPQCRRAQEPACSLCANHIIEWRKARAAGGTLADFMRTAEPLMPVAWYQPEDCTICPDIPAWASSPLCFLHTQRWLQRKAHWKRRGKEGQPDYEAFLASQQPFVPFGKCRVLACPDLAENPVGLCQRHIRRYRKAGWPGGARLPRSWGRWLADRGKTIPVLYDDELAFRKWCAEADPAHRMDGKVSLLGLKPLAKAEIQWCMFQRTQMKVEGGHWPLPWIQYLADDCRNLQVNSLADLDTEAMRNFPAMVAKAMLRMLRMIYFTREDTKDAGYIETEHFGVKLGSHGGQVDLTGTTQRWLRDLLWDQMADRLVASPPRSSSPFDTNRRGCAELSAFLEAHAPQGGHDPRLLDASHMIDFVADQRHRAEHGLPPLAGDRRDHRPPQPVSQGMISGYFNGIRRTLRKALETGDCERLGLDRAFVLAVPTLQRVKRRRRPYPDDVAKAVANEANLQALDAQDVDDRGLRDAWEALVLTGRRCREVLELRLECISRLGGLPMFWYDATKVGNYDEAIRIPERLYQRIERRQAKTVDRFLEREGRVPTPDERGVIALFPSRNSNRQHLKGVSYGWFNRQFRDWIDSLTDIHVVTHQARHTLATNLLKNGANLTHVKRYLGQVSEAMAEHYVHIANTDQRLEDALNAIWVTGPGAPEPGVVLSGGEPMTREQAEAMMIDLTRRSTPAEGGFCTFQVVVDGGACPWQLDCHNCEKFVMSGADLVYWHRKREQWRMLAERAGDPKVADYLHQLFEPTARAIDGLEKALAAVGLLDEALALDLRRPQDYFGRVWATAFRANELAQHEDHGDDFDDEYDTDETEDLS
ncbi:tyrosine-type recombinase/integrase [Streptomyces sp. NEAU-Y11]|uniref:tyrosine-type recombinase/integrase n=1 Tax=Streptomyces cucumeris TaxID=2962890 RepID=UPI0020C876D9|nr:tyrosine-type recombinase/integrase [Streptomyces sp. NEAU-Y11]MCP9209440.1 site-specific integrase [Streptomyces sp. NEAU-Y11]